MPRISSPGPVLPVQGDSVPDLHADPLGPEGYLHILAVNPEGHHKVQHNLVNHLCSSIIPSIQLMSWVLACQKL